MALRRYLHKLHKLFSRVWLYRKKKRREHKTKSQKTEVEREKVGEFFMHFMRSWL